MKWDEPCPHEAEYEALRPVVCQHCAGERIRALEAALRTATKGCDSWLWLRDNWNRLFDPRFPGMLEAATEDARRGHNEGWSVLGEPWRALRGEGG